MHGASTPLDAAHRVQLKDIWDEDLAANDLSTWGLRNLVTQTSRGRIMRYQRRLRLLEAYARSSTSASRILSRLLWRRHACDAVDLGFTIPLNVFGPGLNIAHYGTITVNESAVVGERCRIHPGTLIGRTDAGAPHIGDRCYIGAGAKIYGGITLGDEVVVAPNAVVVANVPSNCVVGGIPARIIRADEPYVWRH